MAEIELKLAVPAAALTRLRGRLRRLGEPRTQLLDTMYFDTPERLLGGQGLALRLRRQGRHWVQTLKSGDASAALSARGEWELPVAGRALELQRLPAAARTALRSAGLDPQAAATLRPGFRTRFRRSTWLVEHDGAQVEIALDEGEVIAGKRRAPLSELEFELKGGAPAALLELALQVVAPGRGAPLPLVPLPESKAARGARLALGKGPEVAKAQAKRVTAGIGADMTAPAALRRVLANGLDVLLANASGFAESDAPEFVHQARVALRRMRSAVRLLGRDADLPEALVEQMHWVAGALGPARDADVLLADTLPPLLAQLPAALQADVAALQSAALSRQAAARSAARATIRSARFALFSLQLMQWCATPPRARAATLSKLAPKRLAQAQRKLFEAGAFFCALAPAERHRVRILAKRLRYALDLFACALPERATAEYVEALSALQDRLGTSNDAAVAVETLPQLTGARPLLEALGAALHAAHASAEELVRAERQLAALAHTTQPWRRKKGKSVKQDKDGK
jgi:inorganic triphosphatase YgiF